MLKKIMYNNRQFAIFSTTEIYKVDFSLVCETSADTLRKSVDETKTFVKWDGGQPAFIDTLTTLEGLYTYEEILSILNNSEWSGTSEPVLVRARNADGTFMADDPSTPDVNEAWTTP